MDRLFLILSLLLLLLIFAPIAGLLVHAARGSGTLWPHLLTYVLPTAAWTTLKLLLGVAFFVSLIGTGTAWLISRYDFPGKRLFEWALILPLAVPTYIIAFAYLDVMHPLGPVQTVLRALFAIDRPQDFWLPEIRSLPGAIFLFGLVLYPYVYLPARALFLMQSPTLLEAGRMLGAKQGRVFFKIALPLARPAIAAGAGFALIEALNDIGAAEFLGVRTLTLAVYTTWVTRSSIEGAAQMALFLLGLVLGLLALERYTRQGGRYAGRARGRESVRTSLSGLSAFLAFLSCFLPILGGFLIPASYLFVHAALRLWREGPPEALIGWALNTITAAAGATLATLVGALILLSTVRVMRGAVGPLMLRLVHLGYALPGTVLAAGLLLPMAMLDNLLSETVTLLTGAQIGLLLFSSGIVLILGLTIRFLAISTGSIEAGFLKIPDSLDASAQLLGAGRWRLLHRIHLPLLQPALAAAALLVFVDCMKELPLTLLLRPLNFETLATIVYGEAARGIYEDGSLAALMIVLTGLAPVILLARTRFRGVF